MLYIEIKADWLKSGLTDFLHEVRWQGASCRSWAKKSNNSIMAHRQSAKTVNNIVHPVEDAREPGEACFEIP